MLNGNITEMWEALFENFPPTNTESEYKGLSLEEILDHDYTLDHLREDNTHLLEE